MPPLRARSRLCLALVGLAALMCLAGAGYGVAGPYTYGHFGYHAGEHSTRARHTLRHGAILPGNVPGSKPPTPGSYYIHHPILTHHLVTATFFVLGDHEWSVRLAAIAAFMATFCLLVLLVWRSFGPQAAAVAALAFAVAPVNSWYAAHIDHGFPALSFLLASFLCYLRWLETGSWRTGIAALVLLDLSQGFEWSPYLISVPLGAHVLWMAVTRRGRHLAYLPVFVAAALLPAALHVVAVRQAGQWADMMGAYRTRAASMLYGPFLETMLAYCKTLLGLPLLAAIALGLVLCLVRLFLGRFRSRDLAFMSLLLATAIYLHLFKVAVVTHAYRLLFTGTLAALALADIHQTGGRWLRRLPGPAGSLAGRLVPGLAVGAVLVATLPTTWKGLHESRDHGGIPGWRVFDPNLPRALFARTLRERSRLGDRIYLHPSFPFRMDIGYDLDRDLEGDAALSTVMRLPVESQRTALVAFAVAALSQDERRIVGQLMARHPYVQLGPFAMIDLRSETPRLEVSRLVQPPPAARPWWRRYLDGPYVLPQPVPDDAQAVRLAIDHALPGAALGPAPPELARPGAGSTTAALLDYRNYYRLRGDGRARDAEAALLATFAGTRTTPPAGGAATVLGWRWRSAQELDLLWAAGRDETVPAFFVRPERGRSPWLRAPAGSARPLPPHAGLWYVDTMLVPASVRPGGGAAAARTPKVASKTGPGIAPESGPAAALEIALVFPGVTAAAAIPPPRGTAGGGFVVVPLPPPPTAKRPPP